MKTGLLEWAFALALTVQGVAGDVKWQQGKRTRWIANGASLSLTSTAPDAKPEVKLADGRLTCSACFLAPVSGEPSDLESVTTPPAAGYADSLEIGASSLAVVKFDDGRFAKLAIDASGYRAGQSSGNNAGVTLTYVLQVRE